MNGSVSLTNNQANIPTDYRCELIAVPGRREKQVFVFVFSCMRLWLCVPEMIYTPVNNNQGPTLLPCSIRSCCCVCSRSQSDRIKAPSLKPQPNWARLSDGRLRRRENTSPGSVKGRRNTWAMKTSCSGGGRMKRNRQLCRGCVFNVDQQLGRRRRVPVKTNIVVLFHHYSVCDTHKPTQVSL